MRKEETEEEEEEDKEKTSEYVGGSGKAMASSKR